MSLRIRKSGAPAAEVTARLGIEPTHAHERGDERINGSPYREALWALSTDADEKGPLADHLSSLLDQVEFRQVELAALANESGLRSGELAELRVKDLDLSTGILTVCRAEQARVTGEMLMTSDRGDTKAVAPSGPIASRRLGVRVVLRH